MSRTLAFVLGLVWLFLAFVFGGKGTKAHLSENEKKWLINEM